MKRILTNFFILCCISGLPVISHAEWIKDTLVQPDGAKSVYFRTVANTLGQDKLTSDQLRELKAIPLMVFDCSFFYIGFPKADQKTLELSGDPIEFKADNTEIFKVDVLNFEDEYIMYSIDEIPELLAAIAQSEHLHVRALLKNTGGLYPEYVQSYIDVSGFERVYEEACAAETFYPHYKMFLK